MTRDLTALQAIAERELAKCSRVLSVAVFG